MLVATSQTLLIYTILLHLAHALPAPKPATTAPALPRGTDPAESKTSLPSTPTPPPVVRNVRGRSQSSSKAHQWSGPKAINLLAHGEVGSSMVLSASRSGPILPTPVGPATASASPSGFKIKTMFGTIYCNVGGGLKKLWGGGDKGSDHGSGGGGNNNDHQENNEHEQHSDHEQNTKSEENKWNSFVSQFQQIWNSQSWESDFFNSQTWSSDTFDTNTWESESWTSDWSSFDTWSSQWASSAGWSNAWSSSEGWTSDSWTSDGWTSGASDVTESMTDSDESNESWTSSDGSSNTWGSSQGWSSATWESGASSQTFSVQSGFTMLTTTNSAGQPMLTLVPIA